MDWAIDSYSVPVLLTVLLGIIFKTWAAIADRWKPIIAILIGMGISIACLLSRGDSLTVKTIISACVYGLMQGATATGLYEIQRVAIKPRS